MAIAIPEKFIEGLGKETKVPEDYPLPPSVITGGMDVMSGTDISVEIDGENINTAMTFSFSRYISGENRDKTITAGTLVLLVDGDREIGRFFNKTGKVVVRGINCKGEKCVLFDDVVKFQNITYRASIDDVITQEVYQFANVEE